MQTPSSGSVPRGQCAESPSPAELEGGDVGVAPTRKTGAGLRTATASAARSAAKIPAFTSGDTLANRPSAVSGRNRFRSPPARRSLAETTWRSWKTRSTSHVRRGAL